MKRLVVTACNTIIGVDETAIGVDSLGQHMNCPFTNGCSGTCDCSYVDDMVIKDGTKVKIKKTGVIGKVCGNDSESTDNFSNVNYYIVPDGKTFNDEIMLLPCEFEILK